ncbi:MAG: hypothetical protein WCH46_00210 [bacterium]
MKQFQNILAFFFLSCLTSISSFASVPDSCVQLCYLHDYYDSTHYGICHNPDSVKVDTCSGSLTHGELYGKKWFNVRFDPYAISLPSAPYDTVLEVRWTSIDTSYTSLRTSFSVLESKFGTLWLRKGSPDLTDPADSSSHVYQMRFENYVCIDSVVNDLENIAGLVRPYFLSNPGFLMTVPNDRGLKPMTPITDIQAAGWNLQSWGFFYQPEFHTRGFGWSLYSINAPMAWEITKGKSSIHIIGVDEFRHQNSTTHPASINPDLIPNFIQNVATTPSTGQEVVGNGKEIADYPCFHLSVVRGRNSREWD